MHTPSTRTPPRAGAPLLPCRPAQPAGGSVSRHLLQASPRKGAFAAAIALLAGVLVWSTPAATPASALSAQATDVPSVALAPLLTTVLEPTFATNAGDGSGRVFVVEKR